MNRPFITAAELRHMMTNLSVWELTAKVVDGMIRDAVNTVGQVNYAEFFKMMNKKRYIAPSGLSTDQRKRNVPTQVARTWVGVDLYETSNAPYPDNP